MRRLTGTRLKKGQGQAFTAAVGEILNGLGDRPDLHPVVYEDIREALIARFPDAVYDQIGPTEVTVLAIFQTSRDPSDWQGRG